MYMKNSPHPGRILKQECLEPLGLSVTDAAKHLRVTRHALNNLVKEKAIVSPQMAIRRGSIYDSQVRWAMRAGFRSPRYTTRWEEIPLVR